MTPNSIYYTNLIKNIESFERGDNITKTTKKLTEKTEKNLKVKHQLISTNLIKRKKKAKKKMHK